MKPARFEYRRPDTLPAALDLLQRHGAEAAVLAGGQSLMPMLNLRMARPSVLIDIGHIPDLDRITAGEGAVIIGARARHVDVLRAALVRQHAPLLPQALRHVAHPAIRNRGTFGGSLALADPAAELPACAVCLGADISLTSARGTRHVPADDFFTGLYGTRREADELLLEVRIPSALPGWRFDFDEVTRRHGDFAMAGLAFAARMAGGRIEECRIVFCGVEAAPRRQASAEACLAGASVADTAARAAAVAGLGEGMDSMASDDVPAAYRLHLAGILLGRALDRLRMECPA
jgi:aerobic carbon-monoxide dehydrogenase medium subunit